MKITRVIEQRREYNYAVDQSGDSPGKILDQVIDEITDEAIKSLKNPHKEITKEIVIDVEGLINDRLEIRQGR
jgi:hypothetical protein